MSYIILDLEWDSIYYKPNKRFINHILQIGGVRLDENFNTIATFDEIIKCDISNRVSSRFAKLTGITSEKMRSGISFSAAVERYNRFAEGADITMTWSTSDLYTILENEEFLLKGGPKFKMKGYLDLQKLVQGYLNTVGYESKNQIALEAAADMMKIDTSGYEFHTALDDCKVCAQLLRLCYDKKRFNTLVRNTENAEFYARLRFKPYAISDINDNSIDRSELKFECPECKGKTKRLKAWKYRNRWFTADFECKECGFKFNGRVAFKKTYDDLQVKHRVCEYRPRKRKNTNDMQSLPETVQSTSN